MELVAGLLEYTPSLRMTPLAACAHKFFDELREPSTRLPNGRELPPLFNFTPSELMIQPALNSILIPKYLQTSSTGTDGAASQQQSQQVSSQETGATSASATSTTPTSTQPAQGSSAAAATPGAGSAANASNVGGNLSSDSASSTQTSSTQIVSNPDQSNMT